MVKQTLSACLTLCLLSGCAFVRKVPFLDRVLERTSPTLGMNRKDIKALRRNARLVCSLTRPAGGWSSTDESNRRLGIAAYYFENDAPGIYVKSCDLYWVSDRKADPKAPKAKPGATTGGEWLEYCFYGTKDTVVGIHRKYVE